jgi:hypothetical protein
MRRFCTNAVRRYMLGERALVPRSGRVRPMLPAVDVEDARRIAQAELDRWNSALTPNRLVNPRATSHDPGDEYVITKIETHARAWIVHFATRRWLETQSISDLAVGTSPLVVDRATGDLHVYGSAEHAEFEGWLDERRP